jgi:hypothetical protein
VTPAQPTFTPVAAGAREAGITSLVPRSAIPRALSNRDLVLASLLLLLFVAAAGSVLRLSARMADVGRLG